MLNPVKNCFLIRVDGTGGAEGAQAPPHLFWIYIVKISQIREEIFFLFSRASHKKFASVHPVVE